MKSDALEEKLGATECESENVKMQCNNVKNVW